MNGIDAQIIVSANHLCKNGYVALPRFMVKFPRCKKIKQASEMFVYDTVYLNSLWDHNGSMRLTADEYNKLMWDAPIVPDKLSPIKITQGMRDEIREKIVYEGKPYNGTN